MDTQEKFEKFLREYYYPELVKSLKEDKAVVVEFPDLDRYDPILADELLESPERVINAFNTAAASVAGVDERINVRIRNLPESRNIRIRNLRAFHLNRLWTINATIRGASEVKPQIYEAIFECPDCKAKINVPQSGKIVQKPAVCECGRRGDFNLIDKKMFDLRWLKAQEPFEVTSGEQPGEIGLTLKEDLTTPRMQKKTDPGSNLVIVGIIKEVPKHIKGKLGTNMDILLEANHVETSQVEFEELDITPEDEMKIKELSANPNIYDLLRASIAPGIYGFDDIKDSVVMQLFGGQVHVLPDGSRVRGNIHILITGDPGCLVGDERIVLGNGSIVKMQDIGKEHLQNINVSILTGEGGKKRDLATVFHFYKNQPVMEVITESGKSIKGTYNHPLLCLRNNGKGILREWKRLDKIKIGDKLAVVTSIPCTITKEIKTGFKPVQRKYGPKFKGKLPKYCDENLAAFMGYALGDGWVDKYEVGFLVAEGEIDILDKLLDMSEALFSIRPSAKKRLIKPSLLGERMINRKQALTYASVNSMDIAGNMGFIKAKRVPDIILRSGNKVVASFLRWLYEADGCAFDKGRGRRSVSLKSRNKELLRDVQILLLRFAIHSRIVGNESLMIRRGKSILKFAKHIGFVSEKKRTKIAQLAKSAKEFGRFKSQRSERVVKIIKHAPEDVYDIEVPKTHRFIANGIISHNTGKTQMLKLVSSIVPRGRYVSGTGASGAGLTATVTKNEALGTWMLEAGALILCNKGLIAIDEFDKMNRDDQIAMHEATSVETVSIAKASIVATLPAQTAVLAGANPKLGRFDPYMSIGEQIQIPETLLSRFDLKFALRDTPSRIGDEQLAEHIITSRKRPDILTPPIPLNLLRKYIAYAKQIKSIELSDEAANMIKNFYIDMRNRYTSGDRQPIAITLRQYEALLRLAEASAKVRLDTVVGKQDAERAIKLMMASLMQLGYDVETQTFDVDRLEGGVTSSKRNKMLQLLKILDDLQKETKEVAVDDLKAEAENQGITNIDEIIDKLHREGMLMYPRPGFLRRVF